MCHSPLPPISIRASIRKLRWSLSRGQPASRSFFKGGITIADLRKGHVSKRRNPLIADLFRRIEMVEAWGRGMPLILKHEPDVKFREVADLFIASFGRPSFAQDTKEATEKMVPQSGFLKAGSGTTRETTQEDSVDPSLQLVDRLVEGLAESQKGILAMVRANRRVSKREMAKELGISTTAVDKNVETLKAKGLLKCVGPDKGGHWEVLK